nr:helix-turn-helix transcriptional regulator [uncultured Bacillus sp.]
MEHKNESHTIEEIAQILKVSKLTVYDLIKKGKLAAYRVGRQMRVDESDLRAYKDNARENVTAAPAVILHHVSDEGQNQSLRNLIISGQDSCLDLLVKFMEGASDHYRPLRTYTGALNGLMSLYNGEVDIVGTHLLDGETMEYNLLYVKKILVSHSFIVINIMARKAGFYVQKGNPKQIASWSDLMRGDITILNREIGSGARVLLDEQLRHNKISPDAVNGYDNIVTSHLGLAASVSKGEADVGVGIEKAAAYTGADFIPLIKERYDLVILKIPENEELIEVLLKILNSREWNEALFSMGYDITNTGNVIYEQ